MELKKILTTTIKLKADISNLLDVVEIEGVTKKLTELVSCAADVEPLLGKTMEAEISISDQFKALVGSVSINATQIAYIHPSWIDTIDGKKCDIGTMFITKANVKINPDYILNTTDGTFVALADLEVCAECGELLDVEGCHLCSTCLEETHFKVLNYSHVPEYQFFGEQKGKLAKECPAWYGLELEYGLPRKRQMAKLIYDSDEKGGNKAIYLKSDSSISGGEYRAEMVTHPMSYDYIMNAKWVDQLATLDAANCPDTNGCHIHISRTAFKTDKAFNKFKYLLLENTKALETVAGRTENPYAQFRASDSPRMSTKDKVIDVKRAAINQAHTHTIECRFFASSDKPEQVKRYIQFLDSMIKYTAYHTNTASYEEYIKYVNKYKEKYSIIYDFIQANLDVFKAGSVEVRTYAKKISPIGDLKISDFIGVTKLIFKNRETGESREATNLERQRRINYDGEKMQDVFGHSIYDNEDVFVEYIA